MQPRLYNGKKVIWQSKTKRILIITSCLLFSIATFCSYDVNQKFIFWGSIMLFGGTGLLLLVQLLNPQNIFTTYDSPLGKQILAEQIKLEQDDIGLFTYHEDRFEVRSNSYRWDDVQTIFAYKEDRITTDELCLNIFIDDNTGLRITESTPGWFQFNQQVTIFHLLPGIGKSL